VASQRVRQISFDHSLKRIFMLTKKYFVTLSDMVIIGSITLFLSACSPKTLHTPVPKQVSMTKLPKGKAPLLNYLGKTNKKLTNRSAFYPLHDPTDAFPIALFLNAMSSFLRSCFRARDNLGLS